MATISTMLKFTDGFSNPLDKLINKTKQATNAQKGLNQSMSSTPAQTLTNKITNLAKGYSALYAASKVINLSDEITLAKSRLGLLTEEIRAANGELETTENLTNKIYSAAQRSRGSYTDMMASVSKLGLLAGDAFGSTDEIVQFTESLNKAFTIGGTSSREQAMAMYQLTQAMGSGRLQGDEFRSIIENAPLLAQYIEDYMRNVKGVKGTLKEWSSEGLLTAEVIKNAVFNMTDEVNERFESMPYTWGQVWTMIKNTVIRAAEPILSLINLIANNWSVIQPIVLGVASAIAFYLIWVNAVTLATKLWAAAQMILNAVMAMNPIGLIILGIILLISLIYAVVAVINKVKGTAVSATGVIVGAVYWVGAVIYNSVVGIIGIFAALLQAIKAIASNIVTAFGNAIASVQAFFYDLLSTAMSVITQIAQALNKLPFVNIDVGGLSAAADNYAAKAAAARASKGTYKDVGAEANKVLDNYYSKMKNLNASYNKGYNKGANWMENLTGGSGGLSGIEGLSGSGDDIGKNTGDTAKNTAKTADAVTKSSEDLKWLREIAERKAINKFTTAQIKVDMGGINNVVNSELDLDGVVTYLEKSLTEKMVSVAEGTHI